MICVAVALFLLATTVYVVVVMARIWEAVDNDQ